MLALYYSLFVVFFFLVILLVTTILLQEGKGVGLGSSFGSDSSSSIFGTSTGDLLKQVTIWASFLFFLFSFLLSHWGGAISHSYSPVGSVMEVSRE